MQVTHIQVELPPTHLETLIRQTCVLSSCSSASLLFSYCFALAVHNINVHNLSKNLYLNRLRDHVIINYTL